MRKFRSIDALRAALVAALGLTPFACGGTIGSSSGDAGAGGGDGGDASARFTCVDPVAVVVGGVDTGYDSCRGGTTRRRAVVACPSLLPRPGGGACGVDSGLPGNGACQSDADCTAQPNGVCSPAGGGGPAGCFCAYGCKTDGDCGGGSICVCGAPVGFCTSATCTTGASCGGSLECADFVRDPGCPGRAFACQSPDDQCFSNADCTTGSMCSEMSGPRTCSPAMCAVGRPFLVRDEARLAPAIARDDWRARGVAPSLDGIGAKTRARLASAWTEIARMEHASIAAFARFALQLLAVGAPPELVEATHAAMSDETTHARLAFALASAYAGAEIGPGPLAIEACLDGCDLASMIATVVKEGCIGETVAALEAREALENARDPIVRDVLATIARDEARHAELAWRTVAWALATGGDPVREAARAAFHDAAGGGRGEGGGPDAAGDLREHGVVSSAMRADLRRAAIDEIVTPCAKALRRSLSRNDVHVGAVERIDHA